MTITVTEFQNLGASLLERVRTSREEVSIVDSGKVVARLVPEMVPSKTKPWHALRGSVVVHGDLTEPLMTAQQVDSGLECEAASLNSVHAD